MKKHVSMYPTAHQNCFAIGVTPKAIIFAKESKGNVILIDNFKHGLEIDNFLVLAMPTKHLLNSSYVLFLSHENHESVLLKLACLKVPLESIYVICPRGKIIQLVIGTFKILDKSVSFSLHLIAMCQHYIYACLLSNIFASCKRKRLQVHSLRPLILKLI
jgi:hypothetical protein